MSNEEKIPLHERKKYNPWDNVGGGIYGKERRFSTGVRYGPCLEARIQAFLDYCSSVSYPPWRFSKSKLFRMAVMSFLDRWERGLDKEDL